MTEPKVTVQREVRPRDAGMIGALTGQRDAAQATVVKMAGELAAAHALIKELQAKLRDKPE